MNKVSGNDRDGGMTTEEELSKVLEPFGKYEKFCDAYVFLSLSGK